MRKKSPEYITHNGRANMSRYYNDIRLILLNDDGNFVDGTIREAPCVHLVIVKTEQNLKFVFFEN